MRCLWVFSVTGLSLLSQAALAGDAVFEIRGWDIERFDPVANKVCFFEHTDAEERAWLEEHGPVCPALLDHLQQHEGRFDALGRWDDACHCTFQSSNFSTFAPLHL